MLNTDQSEQQAAQQIEEANAERPQDNILQPPDEAPSAKRQQHAQVGTGVYARPHKNWWQRFRPLIIAALVVCMLVVSTRLVAGVIDAGSTLTVRIENQQVTTIDLSDGVARSPYVFGVNVFPQTGTQADDGAYGFMSYDSKTLSGLENSGVTMMCFPGGAWGEEHTLSFTQIDDFLRLAQQAHATPLMHVRLAGGSAAEAASMVSYINRKSDPNRLKTPGAPFYPVRYWVIGNEPDLRPNYTVKDYVNDFISFATAMKAVDPTIQIFGPEISQFNGLSSPADAQGMPWMAGFLDSIGAYQRQHNVQLLDGVSFHRYPFGETVGTPGLLFSSAAEWNYTIPLLRDQVRQALGKTIPIAVTEINSSALHGTTASAMATALWWGDTLGMLLEQRISYVGFFAARNVDEPRMLLAQNGDPTPLMRVMQLYRYMAPDVTPLGGSGGPVALYASTNQARDVVTLMLINKSATAAAVTIAANQALSPWPKTTVTVPPYAMLCVVLHRHGGGQTILYAPTPQMLAAGQPGVLTIQPLE